MALWTLIGVAALAFSILTGVVEELGARRAEHRLLAKISAALHPLTQHGYRRIRFSASRRAVHHVGLFIGFLAVAYAAVSLLRLGWSLLAVWF